MASIDDVVAREILDEAVALIANGKDVDDSRAEIAVAFALPAIFGAFACAVVTGIVFGFMPARKAARLDPVTALTSE